VLPETVSRALCGDESAGKSQSAEKTCREKTVDKTSAGSANGTRITKRGSGHVSGTVPILRKITRTQQQQQAKEVRK